MYDFSIIIPAKNENILIIETLKNISNFKNLNFECLVVVDTKYDSVCALVESFSLMDDRVKLLVSNTNGPALAIRSGIEKAQSDVVVITMADGSDDPLTIPPLVNLIKRGVTVACASRYMPGGQQIGAKFLKSTLSRLAGVSLQQIRRVGTRDCTNSFKAYDRTFIQMVGIESEKGFTIGIEMVAKAKHHGKLVAEIPTVWIERKNGKSKFKIWNWLPHYFKWYLYAFQRTKYE